MRILGPAFFLLVGAGFLLAQGGGAPLGMHTRYDLTIDGETFEVTEGQQQVIESRNTPGRKYTVLLVPRKNRQYATDALVFEFDGSLSLNDDHDREGRTVTLFHGIGTAIIVTHMEDGGAHKTEDLLAAVVSNSRGYIERDPVTRLTVSSTEPTRIRHASGHRATIRYFDSDGDETFWDVRVLRGGGRTFSVIVTYVREDEEKTRELLQPVLESIRGR